MIPFSLSINGKNYTREIPQNLLLVDFLRDHLGLQGTRVSCDQGVCGACTVLVDDIPVTSCMTFAFTVDRCDVLTIEGLANGDGSLSALQEAFHSCGVPQCGFCTSGMLMLAEGLRKQERRHLDISEWMSANICRCSGYQGMLRALASLSDNGDKHEE